MKTIYFLPVLLISLWCNAQDGLYPYAEKNKWGLTNQKRAVILEPQFDSIHIFENGYARVENGRKTGLIHASGRVIFPCSYNDIPYVLSNGTAVAKTLKGYLLLDTKTGKQISSLVFDLPHQASLSKENILLAKKEGKISLVNTSTGDLIGKKFAYDDAEFFSEDELKADVIVSVENKYGVAEAATGKEIIPLKYDEIEVWYISKHPVIKATLDEKSTYFYPTGVQVSNDAAKTATEEVLTRMGDKATGDAAPLPGQRRIKDMYIYKLGTDKWRLTLENREFQKAKVLDSFDIKGYSTLEYLVYHDYDKNFPAKIKAVKDGKTGVIDLHGKVLVPFIYDDIIYKEDFIGRYAYLETVIAGKTGVVRAETLTELKKPVLKSVIDEDRDRKALLVQMPGGQRGYMDKASGEIYIPGVKE
jgi:hypothetical protein